MEKELRGKIMKYQSLDAEIFLKSREYVDTVIIPLNPIAFDDTFSQTVSSYEFMTLLTYELEKELKGRVFLAQPLPYIKNGSIEEKSQLLLTWLNFYQSEGFKTIRFFTTDSKWTSIDKEGHVLWIPAVPIDKMPPETIKSVIGEQTKQLAAILEETWFQ